MSKRDEKKKIEVAEAGAGAALKHNPFGALSSASATSTSATNASASNASAADAAVQPAKLADQTNASGRDADAAKTKELKSKGRLVLRREKKQRGGKTVVVVAGLRANAHLPESEIAKIAQHLKQQLGCGGAVERANNDTEIVIQGDQPARVAELLRAMNFRVDGVTQ